MKGLIIIPIVIGSGLLIAGGASVLPHTKVAKTTLLKQKNIQN